MPALQSDRQARTSRCFVIPLALGFVAIVVVGAIAGWWGALLHETDNYRFRPDPRRFLEVMRELQSV